MGASQKSIQSICSPLGLRQSCLSSVMSDFEEEIDYLDVTFGSGYIYSGNVRVFVHKQDTTPLVTLVTPKGIGSQTVNR